MLLKTVFPLNFRKILWKLLLKSFDSKLYNIQFTKAMAKTFAQKMKFSIKDFFSKCEQTRRILRIWSHFLKKSLMGNVYLQCMWNCID